MSSCINQIFKLNLYYRRQDGTKVRDLCRSGEGAQDHPEQPQAQAQQCQGLIHQIHKIHLNKSLHPETPQGKLTKHNKFVRDLIREVAGFAPYERRAQELLRIGKHLSSVVAPSNHLFIFCPKMSNLYSRQGEEVPEVPEEEDWIARPRQEEEGGDAGRAAGTEEEGRRLNSRCLVSPATL